jgi:hypothetical protein
MTEGNRKAGQCYATPIKKQPSLRAPTRNLRSHRHRWFEEILNRVQDDVLLRVIAGPDPQSPFTASAVIRRDPESSSG